MVVSFIAVAVAVTLIAAIYLDVLCFYLYCA